MDSKRLYAESVLIIWMRRGYTREILNKSRAWGEESRERVSKLRRQCLLRYTSKFKWFAVDIINSNTAISRLWRTWNTRKFLSADIIFEIRPLILYEHCARVRKPFTHESREHLLAYRIISYFALVTVLTFWNGYEFHAGKRKIHTKTRNIFSDSGSVYKYARA